MLQAFEPKAGSHARAIWGRALATASGLETMQGQRGPPHIRVSPYAWTFRYVDHGPGLIPCTALVLAADRPPLHGRQRVGDLDLLHRQLIVARQAQTVGGTVRLDLPPKTDADGGC